MTDQEKFAYALRKLRFYNKIIRYGLPEESFNIPEIQAGFLSPFNSEDELKAKKMLVAASTEAIMSNVAIPNSRKEIQARKNAEEICLAFDAVKLDIMPMSVPEREEIIRKNRIAKRAEKLKKAGRMLKKKATKMALGATATALATLVVGAPVAISGAVVYGVVTLMPENWKKTIKKKALDWTEKTATRVENMADRFQRTSIGKRVTEAVKAIKESKVVTTIRKITDPIERTIETAGKIISNTAKKTWDFIKSFL